MKPLWKRLWPPFLIGGVVGGVMGSANEALGIVPFWLSCLSVFVFSFAIAVGSTRVDEE